MDGFVTDAADIVDLCKNGGRRVVAKLVGKYLRAEQIVVGRRQFLVKLIYPVNCQLKRLTRVINKSCPDRYSPDSRLWPKLNKSQAILLLGMRSLLPSAYSVRQRRYTLKPRVK